LTAGAVITRQRPGTAYGFIFLSLEDETGLGNVIVPPDLYERNPPVVIRSNFILAKGKLQTQYTVVHLKASRLLPPTGQAIDVRSHDFP
jgi:error-prone DNA polymerase